MNADPDTAIVFSPAYEALAAWYRAVLDLPEPTRLPGHVGYDLPSLYLGFDEGTGDVPPSSTVTLWFRVDDVDTAFQRALSAGAGEVCPPVDKPWGDRLASVTDPDGNRFGLAQRRPDQG
jgi:lactoylglutathione lyase